MTETVFESERGAIIRDTFRVTTMDGVRLHALRYRRRLRDGRVGLLDRPAGGLLVLPDSGTTVRGVEALIVGLMQAGNGPSLAITFDRRGHGRSETGTVSRIGPDSAGADILAVCDAFGLHHANVIANGRAAFGLLATAPRRPNLFRRIVFNEGGPQLDGVGLARLTVLAKRGRAPTDWAEARQVVQDITPGDFPALDAADWDRRTRAMWREEKGRLVPDVAPACRQSYFDTEEDESRLFWQDLCVLRSRPALLIRGETSPLMPTDLAQRLIAMHGNMADLVALGQGFVPSLEKPDLTAAILDFLDD